MTPNDPRPPQSQIETCGRCGHPKTEHVRVAPDSPLPVSPSILELFVCPTAFFLLDTLQQEMDEAS